MYIKNENGEVLSSARFAAEIVAKILKEADTAVTEDEAKWTLYQSSERLLNKEVLWIQLLERIKKVKRGHKVTGYSEAIVCALSLLLKSEVLNTENVLLIMKYLLKLNRTT